MPYSEALKRCILLIALNDNIFFSGPCMPLSNVACCFRTINSWHFLLFANHTSGVSVSHSSENLLERSKPFLHDSVYENDFTNFSKVCVVGGVASEKINRSIDHCSLHIFAAHDVSLRMFYHQLKVSTSSDERLEGPGSL